MSRGEAPSGEVLAAFSLTGVPVPVRGGQGTAWRVGSVILKPATDPEFQRWLAVLSTVDQRGFRLAEVIAARDGRWVVDGWGAHVVLPGSAPVGPDAPWDEAVAAARSFHRAVASRPRPAFLDTRTDAWAVADRAAWGELDLQASPEAHDLVRRLARVPRPTGPAQLVHGDLAGNVLLGGAGAAGVIDVSPYWRPVTYAEGILVADALAWHDVRPRLLEDLGVPLEGVAVGLLFRVLTASLLSSPGRGQFAMSEEVGRYSGVADALGL